MKTEPTQTCILYFTTGAHSCKTFSSKKKKSVAIQKTLFDKTLSEIRKTKLPFLQSGGNQKGSFYEKLNAALVAVFSAGYEKVVLVGDDTPQLTARQLLQAAENLEQNKISAGPSTDGGTYLIAFNKHQFELGILQNLAWQTKTFYNGLLKNIGDQSLQYEVFQKFSDLDNDLDIQLFLKDLPHLKVTALLQNIWATHTPAANLHKLNQEGYLLSLNDRGPPLAA